MLGVNIVFWYGVLWRVYGIKKWVGEFGIWVYGNMGIGGLVKFNSWWCFDIVFLGGVIRVVLLLKFFLYVCI